MQKAVVLLSGGMDSAVAAAIAGQQFQAVFALSVRYGQRHTAELNAATQVAHMLGIKQHKVVDVDLRSIGGSALTSDDLTVPAAGTTQGIPITYVPARNTVLLSLALAWAEVLHAQHIVCGVNAVDYSGYPDCRPEFIAAFQALANLATKMGVEGEKITLHAPLQRLRKADIVKEGLRLGIDFYATVSCYNASADGLACGRCDACRLRAQGFEEAGVKDHTRYVLS